MINFFRKIRKKLTDYNKPLKYVRYAISEIVLVVIGILIALGINNWNESQKASEFEHKLLTELYSSLQDDIPEVDRIIRGNEVAKKSCQIILDQFQSNHEYHDSLNFHFANANIWWKIILNNTAYETAKNYGLHFLKNDSTRLMLARIFEFNQGWINTMENRQHDYYYTTVVPILTEHFEAINTWRPNRVYGMIPLDYKALKMNKKYINILRTNIENRDFEIGEQRHFMKAMEKIKHRLKKEMDD